MSITDELRKEARGFGRYVYTTPQADCLTAIADRIDAEHQKATRELNNLAGASVLLPIDADGVPFRIGDKVDSDHYEDGTVIGVHYFRAPNGVVFEEIAVQPNGCDTATWRDPEEYAHHHDPTVEDVLREFAYGLGVPVADSYVAASAAKLRLAGDAE